MPADTTRGNLALYAVVVAIWGTTWLAIRYQVGIVDPAWSVAYRFALAALVLFGWALARGESLRLSPRDLAFAGLTGALLFSLNYLFIYAGTLFLVSGLVAVLHATAALFNMVNTRLFFGQPIRPTVLVGGVMGLGGVGLMMAPQITFDGLSGHGILLGTAFVLAGTYCASLGNMVAVRNRRARMPLVSGNAYGMAAGAVLMAIIALLRGVPLQFDLSTPYIVSLVYLALFGSVIAFASYLTLLGRIGADRAGYATVMFPVVAMLLSTVIEGYQWSLGAVLGAMLALAGNLVVMAPSSLWTWLFPQRSIAHNVR